MATIAKIAGVTKPVVYTVLNNREGKGIFASQKTKEKILKIAHELGYVAPKSAKELFSGTSDNIGVIFHDLSHPFAELVSCLQQEANRQNLDITPYLTNGDPQMEEHYLNLTRDGRVDGVLAMSGIEGSVERYRRFAQPPYNLKILRYGEPTPGIFSIHFDEEDAGRQAARHLIEAGCKRLAFFGGCKNYARAKGFTRYLKEKGETAPLLFTGDKSHCALFFPTGKVLAQEFLNLRKLPDGVFASNDLLGIALLSEALKKGLKVPEDMAIIGCDDTEICLYVKPALSSIDIEISLTAKEAIKKIRAIIKGKETVSPHTNIPAVLKPRESTKRQAFRET